MKRVKKIDVYLREDRVPYLESEDTNIYVEEDTKVSDPEVLYDLAQKTRLPEKAQENVLLVMLDAAMHVISLMDVTKGSVNASMFPAREICQAALLAGAVNVALIHNHPSGDVTPSSTDVQSTKRMKESLNMVEISLIEHLIVSRNNYYSMRENNLF